MNTARAQQRRVIDEGYFLLKVMEISADSNLTSAPI